MLIGFQDRFVAAVENGLDELAGRPPRHAGVRPKRQTIRAMRKRRPFRVGDALQLYARARQPDMRLLGEVVARSVKYIEIGFDGQVSVMTGRTLRGYCVGWVTRVARADGFEHLGEMRRFFERTHGLPFLGQMVRW